MSILSTLFAFLKEIIAGRRLARAIRQHDRAAHELDAVLKEVLRR